MALATSSYVAVFSAAVIMLGFPTLPVVAIGPLICTFCILGEPPKAFTISHRLLKFLIPPGNTVRVPLLERAI